MIVNLIVAAIEASALVLFGLFLWVVYEVLLTGAKLGRLP